MYSKWKQRARWNCGWKGGRKGVGKDGVGVRQPESIIFAEREGGGGEREHAATTVPKLCEG